MKNKERCQHIVVLNDSDTLVTCTNDAVVQIGEFGPEGPGAVLGKFCNEHGREIMRQPIRPSFRRIAIDLTSKPPESWTRNVRRWTND